jgi:hypothetical protein
VDVRSGDSDCDEGVVEEVEVEVDGGKEAVPGVTRMRWK